MKKFTLIELLIIIAIIGILTTLFFPSLSRARVTARQAVCLSNQHQISVATFSYILDWGGYGPSDLVGGVKHTWHGRLAQGYLNETLTCPDGMDIYGVRSNIAMNINLTGKDQNPDNIKDQQNIVKATASETCMLMDSYQNWRSARHLYMTSGKLYDGPLEENIAKHNLKANVTFLDGHGTAKGVNFFLSKTSKNDTFWDLEE